MKKTLSLIAALTLSIVGLAPVANAETPNFGADKGGYSADYRTPNTDIKVKGGSLKDLKATDYVIVSSSSSIVTKADDFKSFKPYMNGKVNSVYLMSKTEAEALKASNPRVIIETIKPMSVDTTQSPTPSWGLDRIDSSSTLDSSYSYDTDGTGVKAYIIDTGINTTNTDFTGRLATGYTYFNDGYGYTDCNGHGTHVAGTVAGTTYGVAKKTTIIPVKVLDCAGSGTNLSVISGLNWVMNTHTGGPAVINMSVGGGYDSALNNAVANATAAGFVVVVAAGNDGMNACNYSPSSAASAITVGAVDSTNTFTSWSNYGTCVDISAPGLSIKSDWIGSTTATNTISGTSMATPHTAGVVARLLQANPTKTPSEIATMLANLSAKNLIKSIKTGTVNNLLSLGSSTSTSPSFSISTPSLAWTTGTAVNATVTVTPTVGFTSAAVLTVTGVPAGIAATVTGQSVTYTGAPTTAGNYTVAYKLTEGSVSATNNGSISVTNPIVAPAMPNPTIAKGSSNLTATVTIPTGNARPDTYTFKLYKNGVLFDTATGTFGSTIVSVKYTSPKIARKSGTYVLQVTASNSAGTSPTFISGNYVY